MTYDHMVKVNGKWFGVGDEVEPTSPASVTVEKTVEPTTKEEVVAEKKPATKRSANKGSKK